MLSETRYFKQVEKKNERKMTMKKRIEFQVMQQAIQGDAIAINEILEYFDHLINKLAMSKVVDQYGRTYLFIDEYKKSRLQTKLIESILKYQPRDY